jgi:arsenate reductase-like glutaredoxin family protein
LTVTFTIVEVNKTRIRISQLQKAIEEKKSYAKQVYRERQQFKKMLQAQLKDEEKRLAQQLKVPPCMIS